MAKLPPVSWLRTFDAAARNSSFAAAADELGLTPAAVSQQIKLLERHLKAQLFIRQPRGVVLTDAGHAYAQPVSKSFSDLQIATSGLFHTDRKRIVRVHCSISFAALVLAPRLSAFHTANPDLEIHVTTAVWTDQAASDSFDLEIRYGHGDWRDKNIFHLGNRYAHVVCHPKFAASFGADLCFEKLAEQAVQIIGSEPDWPLMADHFGLELPPVMNGPKADSTLIALQIVAGGTGAAIVSENFSQEYLEQGILVSPFDYRLLMPRGFFLVASDEALKKNEIYRVHEWLLGSDFLLP